MDTDTDDGAIYGKAERDGYEAAERGDESTTNPHPVLTTLWELWEHGYQRHQWQAFAIDCALKLAAVEQRLANLEPKLNDILEATKRSMQP